VSGPADGVETSEIALPRAPRLPEDPALTSLRSAPHRPPLRHVRDWLRETREGRYLLAVLIASIALVTRYLLIPVLGGATPFILMFPAVLLVAWWAGPGPALVATAISCVGSVVVLIEPSFSISDAGRTEV
jgi:K+-sensing histidine kinase KdpD